MTERKISFDRFGDDLSEVIFSFLTIEDKFRFECLSKQWRRLIFSKELVLNVSPNENQFSHRLVSKTETQFEIKYKDFEKCLAKLQFLNDITIDDNIPLNSELLEIIADNCHHLRGISFHVISNSDITKQSIEYFGRKCGLKLKSLALKNRNEDSFEMISHFISFTPNLVSLKLFKNFKMSLFSSENSSEKLPKLKRLKQFECSPIDDKDLMAAMNDYSHQLIRLGLKITDFDIKSRELKRFMSEDYNRLQSLDLTLKLPFTLSAEDMNGMRIKFNRLASNCRQLRRLSINFGCFQACDGNYLSLFSSFTSLTSLEVSLFSALSSIKLKTSFKRLKELSKLKHLMVRYDMNEKDLKQIGEYLPQLESLIIRSKKFLTDSSLQYISELKQLKSLEIHCIRIPKSPSITDSGVKQLLDNCLHFRRFVFKHLYRRALSIRYQSIESFKQKAKQMPKTQYYFGFTATHFELYAKSLQYLPNNLRIDIFRE